MLVPLQLLLLLPGHLLSLHQLQQEKLEIALIFSVLFSNGINMFLASIFLVHQKSMILKYMVK
jgi:hypothetical protein